jgi:hypothetical protein
MDLIRLTLSCVTAFNTVRTFCDIRNCTVGISPLARTFLHPCRHVVRYIPCETCAELLGKLIEPVLPALVQSRSVRFSLPLQLSSVASIGGLSRHRAVSQ